jgi:hypothetical protein
LSVEFVPLAVHAPVFLFGALSEQIVAAPEKRNLEASNFGSVQSQMVGSTSRSVARFGRNRLRLKPQLR